MSASPYQPSTVSAGDDAVAAAESRLAIVASHLAIAEAAWDKKADLAKAKRQYLVAEGLVQLLKCRVYNVNAPTDNPSGLTDLDEASFRSAREASTDSQIRELLALAQAELSEAARSRSAALNEVDQAMKEWKVIHALVIAERMCLIDEKTRRMEETQRRLEEKKRRIEKTKLRVAALATAEEKKTRIDEGHARAARKRFMKLLRDANVAGTQRRSGGTIPETVSDEFRTFGVPAGGGASHGGAKKALRESRKLCASRLAAVPCDPPLVVEWAELDLSDVVGTVPGNALDDVVATIIKAARPDPSVKTTPPVANVLPTRLGPRRLPEPPLRTIDAPPSTPTANDAWTPTRMGHREPPLQTRHCAAPHQSVLRKKIYSWRSSYAVEHLRENGDSRQESWLRTCEG